jgi:glycosyltransferase involved in cell wall biosynthesis
VTVIASDFDYLTRQARHSARTRSVHEGVHFVWLRTGGYSGNDVRRVRSMIRYSVLATWAAVGIRARPDVVIGSSPHLLAGLSASVVARLIRRPWILEIRDFWPSALADLGAIERGGKLHASLERLERYLYADSAAVVTVPPNGYMRLEEMGIDATKCTHIPNSVARQSPTRAATQQPPVTLQRIFADLRGRFILAYVGSVGVTHDFGTFMRGVSSIKDEAPDVYRRLAIVLIGDGIERKRIQELADEMKLSNVRFHPAVEKAAIPWALSRADAGLMQVGPAAYFKYGLSPNKLFDYFASGKPVLIASEQPTIVDEARAGIRYCPGDPHRIAEAVVRLVRTPAGELAAMGAAGYELARTKYSVAAVSDRWENLFQAVLARYAR